MKGRKLYSWNSSGPENNTYITISLTLHFWSCSVLGICVYAHVCVCICLRLGVALGACRSGCVCVCMYMNIHAQHVKLVKTPTQEIVHDLNKSTKWQLSLKKYTLNSYLTSNVGPLSKATHLEKPSHNAGHNSGCFCFTAHLNITLLCSHYAYARTSHSSYLVILFMNLNYKYIETGRILLAWCSLNCFPVLYIFTTSYKYLKLS